MDIHHNPVSCVANSGKRVLPSHHNSFGVLSSRTVTVDSRDRNRNIWVNANNFRVQLPIRMKLVHSVELLEAMIPIPAGVGSERYVVLSLADPRGGGRKQDYEVLEPAQPDGNDPTSLFNPVCDHALTAIRLIDDYADSAASPTAHWRKGEDRAVKFFFPQLASIDTMHLTLFLRTDGATPVPYPLADEPIGVPTDPDNNVFFKFDFVTQN